jgi:CHAT domain-containing protein
MYRIRYFVALILIFLFVSLIACSTTSRIPRPNLALGELRRGNLKRAWQMISAELEHPTVSSQKEFCDLHIITMQTLFKIIDYDFAPSNSDQIIKKSYDYVCMNCQSLKGRVRKAENLYGSYLGQSRRPGLAIIHFKIGREYFKTRRFKDRKKAARQWYEYYSLLHHRLLFLAMPENSADKLSQMYELWNEIESINKRWIEKVRCFAYINASIAFTRAGDIAFARKLLKTAKALAEKYPGENQEHARLDLQDAEAHILGTEGKFREAAALLQDRIERFPKLTGESPHNLDFQSVGLAQESAQNYDRAIEYLEKSIEKTEKVRSSYKVKSRSQFFRTFYVETYWGLLRSYASRYLEQRQEEDFQGAIKAARMLRARQFGELLEIGFGVEDEMDISKFRLKPDELLLNIVLTDRAIVIFAISSDWHDLFMMPYERTVFKAIAGRTRSQISTPGDPGTVIDDLQYISKTVITPIRSRLETVKRLIVIPDGLLNGIPFTLLSKSPDHYDPLILDHEVVLTPSLSYLIKQRNSEYQLKSDKLFALADPAYGVRAVPEAYRDDTMRFYKRAAGDFNLFEPLAETRIEVENIARLFRPTDVTSVFGNEATESNVKSLELKGYRYLHFATHGILGNQIPGINEPALVLAAEPEHSGQDGFLTLSEVVEDLKLNSELTVLSACDTGSGRYFTGEGIMGLSRGFLVAGSRAVIVSLWPVASEEAVELMTLFYQYLRSGKSKAESLRLAQLALMGGEKAKTSSERGIKVTGRIRFEKYSIHPYYWAPFVLIGE